MPRPARPATARSAASLVRSRIEGGGGRFWTYSDFRDLPTSAVATTLSRLAREGILQRTSKGVYYRPIQTSFGYSMAGASAAAAQTLTAPLYPAGLTAANMLGLSTQNPGRAEYATTAAGAPTALRNATVHPGRPSQRTGLATEDGAILETLRERARSSDLTPQQTVRRLMRLLAEDERFGRLAEAALAEPPRVRAMLGALGQELDMPPRILRRLHESLNPLSRFDFGRLACLRYAAEWQAK